VTLDGGLFVVRSAISCRIAFIAAAASIATSICHADEPASPKAHLIQGDSDTIHDVLGIQIGMYCADAINLSKTFSIAKNTGSTYPWLSFGEFGGQGRLDKADVRYSYKKYQVVINTMTFACLDDGGSREVFSIHRQIEYMDPTVAPAIASLIGLFQQKYGVPSVKYSNTLFATMFNGNGVLTSLDNDCGKYQNGHFYASADPAFVNFDSNKCSYTLTFEATEARRPPGSISFLAIDINDYLRLTNTARLMEKHRLDTTKAALPKL
jgi:hypothetical protein